MLEEAAKDTTATSSSIRTRTALWFMALEELNSALSKSSNEDLLRVVLQADRSFAAQP